MPAYSYKERFVIYVMNGSKRQTVRARRKHPPRKGQIAYNFFGMRTRNCMKLNEAEITDVVGIVVNEKEGIILYNGPIDTIGLEVAKQDPHNKALPFHIILEPIDRDLFAWEDGFRPKGSSKKKPDGCFELMLRFWRLTHDLPFSGDVIYW